MRQVIVSKVGAGVSAKTSVGAPQFQVLNADGVWTLWAAVSTDVDPLYRIFKAGDADNAAQVSPPFRKSAIQSCVATHTAPSSPQTSTLTPTAGVVNEKFILKIIETSGGYEPFPRVNIEISTATATVNATATAINTAVAAAIAVKGSVASKIMASSSNPTGTCAIIAKDGMRLEFALDAQDSTVAISNAKTNAVAGVGVGADIIKEEKLQQGREYSGYDRLVAFDTFADVTVAVSGDTYHLIKFIVKNDAPNQINGVDNMREIKVYLDEGATSDIYDLVDGAGTGFGSAIKDEGLVGAAITFDA
tara:strand:+ start:92105 stop:93019 length:915 start_codon:yes stop_codon:yes gene_type:complete